MATSTIKSSYKVGTVSASGGSTVSGLTVRQDGRTVTINGFVGNVTTTANTEKQIASFSGVDMPKEAIRTVCGVAQYAYQHPADVAYLSITTEGKIYINSTITGTRAVYFTASYTI